MYKIFTFDKGNWFLEKIFKVSKSSSTNTVFGARNSRYATIISPHTHAFLDLPLQSNGLK